jgi:hypothetical protein
VGGYAGLGLWIGCVGEPSGRSARRAVPHRLCTMIGTRIVRQGHDLVAAAELLGHARLDQTRRQSCPPKPTANAPSTACSPTTDPDQGRWSDYTYLVATRNEEDQDTGAE